MIINENTAEILELKKTLTPFRENLTGELGRLALDSLTAAENFEILKEREKLLREWLALTDSNGEFKFNASIDPVSFMFENAKRSGILSGSELVKVRLLLHSARHIKEGLAEISENFKAVDELRRGIRDFSPELDALSVIEDSGRLADTASNKLFNLRNEIENLKRNGRRIAQKLFEDAEINNMLQERSLSWREGRFLMLVRQEFINRFTQLAESD